MDIRLVGVVLVYLKEAHSGVENDTSAARVIQRRATEGRAVGTVESRAPHHVVSDTGRLERMGKVGSDRHLLSGRERSACDAISLYRAGIVTSEKLWRHQSRARVDHDRTRREIAETRRGHAANHLDALERGRWDASELSPAACGRHW